MATLPIDEPYVTVEEYLHTSYRPDCDYVDGQIEERNLGEYDHGLLQLALGVLFTANREAWEVRVVTDVRTQVKRTRYRVPDLSVLRANAPREQIITHPPLIAIEILSPEDRLSRFQERIDDYVEFGVGNIWIIDPAKRRAWVCSRGRFEEPEGRILAVPSSAIQIPLDSLFAELD